MFVGVATLYLVWKQNQLQESMAVWQRTVDAREMYDRIERDLRLVREQLDAIPNTLENEEIRSKVHEKGLVLMEYLCHLIDVKTIDDPFLIDRSDDLVSEWAPSLWFCELPIREQIDEMALYPKLFHRAQTTDERREAIIQAAVSKANAAIHDIGRIERDFNDKVDRIDQGFVRYWWNRLTGRKSEKRSLPDS